MYYASKFEISSSVRHHCSSVGSWPLVPLTLGGGKETFKMRANCNMYSCSY